MPRHEYGVPRPQCLACGLHHHTFYAAYIRHHRAVHHQRRKLGQDGLDRGHRHRHDDHVSATHGGRERYLGTIDDTEVHRSLQLAQAAPETHHIAHMSALAQGARQRTADKADTDNGELVNHGNRQS